MAAQPNRTKSALLGFLSWGEMSGYDLSQLIAGSISNFWQESDGRIYPMLAQLVEEGLAGRRETQSEGGRLRHVYAITERGRAAFAEWLRQPARPRPPRNERLLKLFFGARTEPEVSLRHVEDLHALAAGHLEHYAEIRERLEGQAGAPRDRVFWLMTLRYGELEAKAQLEWCDETLALLRAQQPPTGGSPT